jgi:hypothetical protein
MKALRSEVERVVAPLQANPWRKNRIREELLAHLTALYEDEVARNAEPLQSLAAALARFGEPAELTRNLQATVPLAERVLCYRFPGNAWTDRRPTETAIAHIFRTARYATACVAISNLVLIGVVAVIAQFASRRPVPEKPPLVNVAAFLALCAFVQCLLIVIPPLCGELIHRQASLYLTSRDYRWRARHAALVAVGLLLATATGTLAAAVVTGTFGPLLRIPIVNERQFWLVVASAAAVTFCLMIIQSWQQAQRARQFDDWDGAETEPAQ